MSIGKLRQRWESDYDRASTANAVIAANTVVSGSETVNPVAPLSAFLFWSLDLEPALFALLDDDWLEDAFLLCEPEVPAELDLLAAAADWG